MMNKMFASIGMPVDGLFGDACEVSAQRPGDFDVSGELQDILHGPLVALSRPTSPTQ